MFKKPSGRRRLLREKKTSGNIKIKYVNKINEANSCIDENYNEKQNDKKAEKKEMVKKFTSAFPLPSLGSASRYTQVGQVARARRRYPTPLPTSLPPLTTATHPHPLTHAQWSPHKRPPLPLPSPSHSPLPPTPVPSPTVKGGAQRTCRCETGRWEEGGRRGGGWRKKRRRKEKSRKEEKEQGGGVRRRGTRKPEEVGRDKETKKMKKKEESVGYQSGR